jgi:hypothetical protein
MSEWQVAAGQAAAFDLGKFSFTTPRADGFVFTQISRHVGLDEREEKRQVGNRGLSLGLTTIVTKTTVPKSWISSA